MHLPPDANQKGKPRHPYSAVYQQLQDACAGHLVRPGHAADPCARGRTPASGPHGTGLTRCGQGQAKLPPGPTSYFAGRPS